jgi:1,4-dihydroxy-2-naphthoate octaprenyltransferase
VFFALVAHAGINVLNDYYDALNGTDAANTERQFPFTGGSRFIQNGVLSLGAAGLFGYALLAAVIPAGLWLAWTSASGLILIGLAGLFVGWAYSAPPLKLHEPRLGRAGGGLRLADRRRRRDYVQRGAFSPLPFVAGLPYALHVANVLFINQFPDCTRRMPPSASATGWCASARSARATAIR